MSSRPSSITSNSLDEVESKSTPARATHWQLVASQSLVIDEVLHHKYSGNGTEPSPYIVEWIPSDPRNPMLWPQWKKWAITLMVAFATLAVSFASSAYSGSVEQTIGEFSCSEEVATLGISLFVLGFAIGPLLWAPLSELYGRQILFTGTYGALTVFTAGGAGSNSMATLLVLRFLGGASGSSVLTNSGGVIADMFPAAQRGLATSIFAAAPFLGPTLGPIVGGFVGETVGWRWVQGVTAIFIGILWISGTFLIPETYAPVLLQRRARKLSKITGNVYISKLEAEKGRISLDKAFKTALSRPWILLFREPIVLLLSIYMAIIYGTLYLTFGAFPIVYQQTRGWSAGIGGLAFLGVMIGMMIGVISTIPDNKRYKSVADKHNGAAPPEARLPPALIGSVAIPLGLIIFAWTNYPDIHWIVSIIFTAPFGFGMVLVFLSVMNYLIDAYTIYAASVLAANSVLRSLFGAIFPLFTTSMYQNLGIHWASSVPAFLALACVPFPFLFYQYGAAIRKKCKFAAEAAKVLEEMRSKSSPASDEKTKTTGTPSADRDVERNASLSE
ncbi:MAG: MFS siderochrome iron transporter 1 [Sclerophora amabilis]|nr:MAG: MFS siderochrome iron transporter 1 [Sclerophora amabilis]